MRSWLTVGWRLLAGRGLRVVARRAVFVAVVVGVGGVLSLGVTLARLSFESGSGAESAIDSAGPLFRPPGGSLVICGGGPVAPEIRARFVELAGGPDARLVVIPTASRVRDPEPSGVMEPWKGYRVASLGVLHTRSREEADNTEFVRPLAEATGVWIAGGFQESLTRVYLGTEVERLLQKVLARGGVIGGTSAGAAVMSRVMIAGGRDEARVARGFDLLPGAVIDQHFLKRNRLRRLLGVVSRRPDLLGLGIDEQTALVVDVRARRARVLGRSYVVACVPEAIKVAAKAVAANPIASASASSTSVTAGGLEPEPDLESSSTRLEFLKAGDEADLAALKALNGNAVVSALNLDAL
jgi:cyanophycinase